MHLLYRILKNESFEVKTHVQKFEFEVFVLSDKVNQMLLFKTALSLPCTKNAEISIDQSVTFKVAFVRQLILFDPCVGQVPYKMFIVWPSIRLFFCQQQLVLKSVNSAFFHVDRNLQSTKTNGAQFLVKICFSPYLGKKLPKIYDLSFFLKSFVV